MNARFVLKLEPCIVKVFCIISKKRGSPKMYTPNMDIKFKNKGFRSIFAGCQKRLPRNIEKIPCIFAAPAKLFPNITTVIAYKHNYTQDCRIFKENPQPANPQFWE